MAQTLMGIAPSASSVSRLNQSLTEQFEAWRTRPLLDHSRVISLDGIHFQVRHGDKTDSTMIVTALGVDLTGSASACSASVPAQRKARTAAVSCSPICAAVSVQSIDLLADFWT